jgi:IclR family mhp operon transcriptional activator
MKADQELRSLKRGLKVLALLNETETISITELARHLALPRTTAERILLTLLAEGYVQRVPDDKRYRLSAKVCGLANGFSEDCWIVETATPLLFSLTRRIGWPLAIATASGDRMVLRSTTDPATTLWLHRRRVGASIAMLNSSSGLVAYAFAEEAERARLRTLLRTSSDSWNRQRAENGSALDLLIGPVVENGFAFQPPPGNAPEQSISFPIFMGGRCVASLMMIYMTQAMNSSHVVAEYAPHLRMLAARIGEAATSRQPLDDDGEIRLPDFHAMRGAAELQRAL